MRKILGKLVLPILEWCEKKIIRLSAIDAISEPEKVILSARMIVQLQKEIARRELPTSFDSFETEDLRVISKALDIMDKRFVDKPRLKVKLDTTELDKFVKPPPLPEFPYPIQPFKK